MSIAYGRPVGQNKLKKFKSDILYITTNQNVQLLLSYGWRFIDILLYLLGGGVALLTTSFSASTSFLSPVLHRNRDG